MAAKWRPARPPALRPLWGLGERTSSTLAVRSTGRGDLGRVRQQGGGFGDGWRALSAARHNAHRLGTGAVAGGPGLRRVPALGAPARGSTLRWSRRRPGCRRRAGGCAVLRETALARFVEERPRDVVAAAASSREARRTRPHSLSTHAVLAHVMIHWVAPAWPFNGFVHTVAPRGALAPWQGRSHFVTHVSRVR